MPVFTARYSLRGAVAATALCLASHAAWAGFVLTPSSTAVVRGESFQATLSYDGDVALDWALAVDLSASVAGFTLKGLRPLVSLDSVLVGPGPGLDTGVPQPLPAYISALLNGPVGGPSNPVELWEFEIAVDAAMALGAVTLFAEGESSDSNFSPIPYNVFVDLRVDDSGGGQVPEGGTLPSVMIALAALALVRRAVPPRQR